jgi:hypothetical protein
MRDNLVILFRDRADELGNFNLACPLVIRLQACCKFREKFFHSDPWKVGILDGCLIGVKLRSRNEATKKNNKARMIMLTSTVDAVGMLYVKFPVLKSLLRAPTDMMSLADSTFSFISA